MSKDAFDSVDDIAFRLEKNDNIVQEGTTKEMLWKIDALISYVSQYFTLKIGDVIFTGTPAGVGPVAVNDKLKGFIGDKQLFSIHVK